MEGVEVPVAPENAPGLVAAADDGPARRALGERGAELRLVLELISAVQAARDRREGVRRLVAAVAAMLPGSDAVVLYGGREGVRRIESHRLGRLPSESPRARRVRERASAFLGASAGELTRAAAETFGWRRAWRLPLNGPRGQLGSLLIGGERLPPEVIRRLLAEAAGALGGAVWGRPAVAPLVRVREVAGTRRRVVIGALAAVLLVGLYPARHRARCRLQVEPVRQRIVAAPFEAALRRSRVEPGDRVDAGAVLAELDGRELRIEREGVEADLRQAQKRHDSALASGRVADAQLAELESRQLERRLELLDGRLENLQIRSPIAGVVVSGRLERSEGAVFSTGQAMLEVAPLDRMRLELEIEECDYRFTAVGDPVRVSLDALPGNRLDGPLERIYPEAETRDGRGVFVGVREVENRRGRLRPGMRGRGTIYGPRRPLAWLWARRGIERLTRLVGWS